MAISLTPNYSLRKHDAGDLNWDVDLNWNLNEIDTQIKARDTDLNTTHVGKQLDPADTNSDKTKHLSNAQGKKWEDHVGTVSGNPHSVTASDVGAVALLSGDTASRPAAPATGWMYFDTTLGQPIWYDGSGWVDATGTTT